MSFAALKKSSKNALDTLGKKFEEEKTGGYSRDERFWKLDVDKTGNGMATIRFLPPSADEEVPYVKRFEYFVKLNGKVYAENCRSTLGRNERDPMNEYFFEQRGDGKDEARNNKARQFSRGTNYIANIYIVDDPKHPENNGKVFLFKFGSRIFQKLEGAITPEFEDEKPFNPFDMWSGANFKLKARMLNDQRSYDKSAFEPCGPLLDDDDELEAIWKSQYPLLPEIAPDKFKSYDELKAKLDAILAATPGGAPARRQEAGNNDDGDDYVPRRPSRAAAPADDGEPAAQRRSAAPKPQRTADADDAPAEKPAARPAPKASADDGDDEMARYRAMLGDD